MPNVYAVAWKALKARIAKSRRRSISKADLVQWQLEALEQATDEYAEAAAPTIVVNPERYIGEQEKA
ncbi:hypothetical protein LCGC14_2539470 [marine sediment metagenome]|uniref:Uncharacterized protein n=1 Tax=marine sediment metagenome TaxID=412755 RepID=A0A0F9BDY0_9ZZZZ